MAKTKGNNNILQIILKLLSYIVIAFVCAITFFLLYYIVNSQLHANDEKYKPGISVYTIVSPSMTPVIKVYDIVVNARVSSPEKIEIGDIITYKSQAANSQGMTITHRVVAIDKTEDGRYEYMTQGDNNSEPDSLFVTYDQVIGKEIMIIPKLGKLQFLIANKRNWLLLLLIPIGIYLVKELFKLIDLFGLRKKVVKVMEPKPESTTYKPTKLQIEERKEQIRENLKNNETLKDSYIKSRLEPESFLEKYTETKVEVKTNKYANLKKKSKEIITPAVEEDKKIDHIEKVSVKDVKEVEPEKQIVLPKQKVEIQDQYEILDTDELSSKIKEYDDKIVQLNKMMADIDNLKDKKEEPKEEPFIEVDNFLKGGKIKVTKIEETKNQKRKVASKRITDPSKYVEEVKIELNPIIGTPTYNSRTKIARPNSVDIKELRSIEKPVPKKEEPKKKKRLNLNPREVTKVTKKQQQNQQKPKSTKKSLSLNPRTVQKATRNKKSMPVQQPIMQPVTQPIQPVEQPKPTRKKKREKFIIIEKIK